METDPPYALNNYFTLFYNCRDCNHHSDHYDDNNCFIHFTEPFFCSTFHFQNSSLVSEQSIGTLTYFIDFILLFFNQRIDLSGLFSVG